MRPTSCDLVFTLVGKDKLCDSGYDPIRLFPQHHSFTALPAAAIFMFRILGTAIQLWIRHLPLIALLVLTVWLPGNLFVGWSYHFGSQESAELQVWRMTLLIEAICSPIYAGAIVYALPRLMRGQQVSYAEAMGVGFRYWGRLFAARFIAGLLAVVGFVAFVIPGIVLSVRFSLIDSAVVLEDRGVSSARERSWTLTHGRSWQVFGAILIIYLVTITLAVVLYVPLMIVEQFWTPDLVVYFGVEVVLDCILDVAYTLDVIVMFLFFVEASGYSEQSTPASPTLGDDENAEPFVVSPEEDTNPYRPPSA